MIATVNATPGWRLLESGQGDRVILTAGEPAGFLTAMAAGWIRGLKYDLERLFDFRIPRTIGTRNGNWISLVLRITNTNIFDVCIFRRLDRESFE